MTIDASINAMLVSDNAGIYYSDGFRNVLEDHMTYLREHPTTTILSVLPMQAYKYEFDMVGLLRELNIPLRMHWTVIRMNHLSSLTQVPSDLQQLLIPTDQQLSRIKQTYEASLKIST